MIQYSYKIQGRRDRCMLQWLQALRELMLSSLQQGVCTRGVASLQYVHTMCQTYKPG